MLWGGGHCRSALEANASGAYVLVTCARAGRAVSVCANCRQGASHNSSQSTQHVEREAYRTQGREERHDTAYLGNLHAVGHLLSSCQAGSCQLFSWAAW